ncbi:MAG: hypothetical protein CMI54_06320 [Parcubacteria group bacterium]|jgi:hypothetical protein|nr:hypothetical protein [Parcubacteria group bacterium]|tara:strand:- start:5047 stop:5433 length:387 start_codon:yes stop_codon:yes gene_type:complete
MSAFYDNMLGVAESLLTDFGQSIPIDQIEQDVDLVEGCIASKTTVTHSFSGAVFPTTKEEDKKVFDGLTNIESRKLLLSASGAPFVPSNGNRVTLETTFWTVEHCNILSPAGIDLTYEVFIRKGSAKP